MSEFFQIMGLPLLACLVLTGIHTYLGFHVIERQVIFVDLALAQIAVLGSSLAIVSGFEMDSTRGYAFSLIFTIIGAAIFALTRFKKQKLPQEAIIGIIYAVSAAALVMVLSRFGEGDEHIRQTLVGNILLVNWPQIIKLFLIYALVGALHFYCRRQFFLISEDPQRAFREGLNVRWWDFLFYVSLGVVVTSSVAIAGVLLVFSFLVAPAICAMLFSDNIRLRLLLGWITGLLASILGMAVSYYFDLPTGASVVCAFGALLLLSGLGKYVLGRLGQ